MARTATAALAVVLAGLVYPAYAGSSAPSIEVGQDVPPPAGFGDVCARYAWACAHSGRRSSLGADVLVLARSVNLEVNRRTSEISDARQYGRDEYWALPTSRGGDCEDFALAKKQALIAAGVAPERLLISTVLDRSQGPHAVLVLRTDSGDYVLDNLTDRIMLWTETGYTYLRMQNPRSPGAWSAVLAGGLLADLGY